MAYTNLERRLGNARRGKQTRRWKHIGLTAADTWRCGQNVRTKQLLKGLECSRSSPFYSLLFTTAFSLYELYLQLQSKLPVILILASIRGSSMAIFAKMT